MESIITAQMLLEKIQKLPNKNIPIEIPGGIVTTVSVRSSGTGEKLVLTAEKGQF